MDKFFDDFNFNHNNKFLLEFTKFNSPIEYDNQQDLNWDYIISMCKHHRLFGLVYRNIQKEDWIPQDIKEIIKNEYNDYFKQNQYFFTNAYEVFKKLNEQEISFVVLKGFALSHKVYKNLGIRKCGDVDILIDKNYISKAKKVFKELGYVQGDFHEEQSIIIKPTREELLMHETYTHELVQFVKVDEVNKRPVYIDVNFEFSWKGNALFTPPQVSFNDIYRTREELIVNNEKIYILNHQYNILHLCCHLYNESIFFIYDDVDTLDELSLYRFCDIRDCILTTEVDWELLDKIIVDAGAEEQVWYTFKIIQRLWKGIIPTEFMELLERRNFDEEILNKYCMKDGNYGSWGLSIEERLFNLDKKINEKITMCI